MKGSFAFAAVCCICVLAAIMAAGCTGSTESTPATTVATAPPTTAAPVTTTAVPALSATTAVAATTAVLATPTTASVTTVFVNSTANGKIITIPYGERVLVALDENPTTGYSWSATASKGLTIVSDSYIAPDTTLVGAGGYHEWLLSPETVDTYTFKAVYMRSWEGATATDKTFGIVIQATQD